MRLTVATPGIARRSAGAGHAPLAGRALALLAQFLVVFGALMAPAMAAPGAGANGGDGSGGVMSCSSNGGTTACTPRHAGAGRTERPSR